MLTVAVVLSAAMASKIDSKKNEHNLTKLKYDLIDDKSKATIVSPTDRFASLILVLALILSFSGLLAPFFL